MKSSHLSSLGSANASLMRRLNRSAILDLMRQKSPISPSELSHKLHISMPTIMRILDELMQENLVYRLDSQEKSGGRPRSLLAINAIAHAVIGLDLGGTKMYGTSADLNGNILAEIYHPSAPGQPEDNLTILYQLIEELIEKTKISGQNILGIGVGVPGITLQQKGIITWAPSLGWRDLALRDLLQERFRIPVQVENDVNLAALGEYGFGAAKGTSSLVCLAVGTGIGSGIVLDRKIYRGFHQSAGEVGYLPPSPAALGKHYEHFGALESLASGTGVEERARQIIKRRGLNVDLQNFSAETVFQAAREGVGWAQEIIEETVDYLALVIAAISVVLDPEVIVLGGGVSRSADILIEPILTRLEGVLPAPVQLVVSTLGYRAAVMGAIMLILDMTTDHITINTN